MQKSPMAGLVAAMGDFFFFISNPSACSGKDAAQKAFASISKRSKLPKETARKPEGFR